MGSPRVHYGQLDWTGGNMSGDRPARHQRGENKGLTNCTIDNLGTTTWTGAGDINSGIGAVFNDLAGAPFYAQNDQAVQRVPAAATPPSTIRAPSGRPWQWGPRQWPYSSTTPAPSTYRPVLSKSRGAAPDFHIARGQDELTIEITGDSLTSPYCPIGKQRMCGRPWAT